MKCKNNYCEKQAKYGGYCESCFVKRGHLKEKCKKIIRITVSNKGIRFGREGIEYERS